MTPPRPPSARPWILITLIVICAVLEGILLLGDFGVLPIPRVRQVAYEYGGFWPGLLDQWRPNYAIQPYAMFVTYSFLHSGALHLAFNMVTLWSLGQAMIRRVGGAGFALVYTASVLGGGIGFGLLAETIRPMVGASGGLFGLAGGILAWNYVDRFYAAAGLWPVARSVAFLLALNIVMWWLMDGLLAWQTHLGGFVAGWITALLVDPRSRPEVDD